MADTLLYLFDEIFESSSFTMILTKQELADLSGMSKESAIQLLRQFNKEGIISITRNEIKLLDKEQLMRMSQFC